MNEKAQEHLFQAARILFRDPQASGAAGVTAVFRVEPGVHSVSTYRFDIDGYEHFFLTETDEFGNRMLQSRSEAQLPNDKAWVVCLLQVRAGGKMSCDFEYDDVERWAVRPASYEEDIERLRPTTT